MATQTKTATKTVKPIPEGFHTITSTFICKDATKSIEFYKKGLGATEVSKFCCDESGKIMHAELKVGDSIFFVADEMPAMGCMLQPTALWLYVNDCDASFKKMIDAGATQKIPCTDMFWGDRMGTVIDPNGHQWTFATRKQDLTPEQMLAGQKVWKEQMKAQMAEKGQSCSSTKSCS